ncbi:Cell division cycle protein 123 [Balamuthia mandrillaris]
MLAEQLKKVALKRVADAPDKAADALPRPALCEDGEDYTRLMEETYFEEYWEKIKPLSFTSTFVPLSKKAAAALMAAHKAFLATKNEDSQQSSGNWKEEHPELAQLVEDINAAQKLLDREHVFVRLSSRSPKDAALSRQGFKSLLEEELQQVKRLEGESATSSDNQLLHALYRASTVALKVSNGEEGVQLLVESPRIQGDLDAYLHSQKEDETFNVVVREWGEFDVELEFRAFVYQNKFTALTQYNEFIFFPRMLSQKDTILSVITDFLHKEVMPLMTLPNYVLDLALKYPSGEGEREEASTYRGFKLYVVELNPLAEFAGSGLFDWTKDWDVLLGKKPFEFRVHESEPPHARQQIAGNWWSPFAS